MTEKVRRQQRSAMWMEARNLERELAETLPQRLRDQFSGGFDEVHHRKEPEAFAERLAGLAQLILDPQAPLRQLDAEQWREI